MGLFENITSATTTVVDSGAGMLRDVVVNTVAAGTVTIYDNTSGSGTKIGVLTVPATASPAHVSYDVTYLTGLTIVTSATMDVTVTFEHFPETA